MCRYLTLANEVLEMVSQQSDIPIEVIISKSRNADVVDARHLAINLLFGLGLYPQQIAKVVHQSTRTIQCAISAFSVRCKANNNLRHTFYYLRNKCAENAR